MTVTIGRRELLAALGGAAAAWPVATRAQQGGNPPLVAYLTGVAAPPNAYSDIFVQGLRDLNVIEGRDFRITYRGSGGYGNRLPALAKELIGLKPEVILATAVDSAVAVRNLTRTIPIVSPALADAVHLGLIASEARPGGNVTGIEPYVAGLPAKQMELAREVVAKREEGGRANQSARPESGTAAAGAGGRGPRLGSRDRPIGCQYA